MIRDIRRILIELGDMKHDRVAEIEIHPPSQTMTVRTFPHGGSGEWIRMPLTEAVDQLRAIQSRHVERSSPSQPRPSDTSGQEGR